MVKKREGLMGRLFSLGLSSGFAGLESKRVKLKRAQVFLKPVVRHSAAMNGSSAFRVCIVGLVSRHSAPKQEGA